MAKNIRQTDPIINFNPKLLNKKTLRNNHSDYEDSGNLFLKLGSFQKNSHSANLVSKTKNLTLNNILTYIGFEFCILSGLRKDLFIKLL